MGIRHVSRLSDDVDVLAFARRINSQFLRAGLTELRKLDAEHEAVLLEQDGRIDSIIVFYRYDDLDDVATYYLTIVWTSPRARGEGAYRQLLEWVKQYARDKGARRLSTDVHHDNKRMIPHKEKHWQKTFVRFNLPL